ncbi:hypothetical protein RB596_002473 [Gaeumannomyces avenae]
MPGVPLRYPWRGSLTWPLKGDPRRYSTFPPYRDGHPLEGIGGKVVDCTKAFFVKLFCIVRLLLWNFPAGLIIGTAAGIFICRNGHIKVLEPGLGRDHVQVSEAHGGGYVVDILGVDHLECLLICRADLEVRGQLWWNRSDPQPGPDLASEQHSCHDFHALRGLIERRQIPQQIPAGYYLQPRPYQILDTEPWS